MSYIWNPKKKDGLVHIATDRGSMCKMENNGRVIKAFTEWAESVPGNRTLCKICIANERGEKWHQKGPHKAPQNNWRRPGRDEGVKCSW